MEQIKIIRLDETDSTNRFMRDYAGEEGRLMTVVAASHQTAGRGQGRNSWESEAGKNLLLSVKTCPARLEARRQFVMLEAVALAVRDTLAAYADGFTVKWPNDVYWHDFKISGTLSECTISKGLVGDCILGVGINVNQRRFVSGAPNPVSLLGIIGREVDTEDVLNSFLSHLEGCLRLVNQGRFDTLHQAYADALYRKTGLHAYRDTEGEFLAELEKVELGGRLLLKRVDGRRSAYLFKEVEFIISRPAF